MATGWTELPLGDLVTHKKGFAFKSVDFMKDGGRRVIRVSDTDANSIKSDDPIFLPESQALQFSDYALQPGDIILTTVGSRPPLYDSMVGKTIRVPQSAAGSLLNQNMVKLCPKTELIDSGFLYSVLKTRKFIFHIEGSARGNANQASITLDDTFEFPVLVPPLPEQRKIAEILSCWDEGITKIDREINLKSLFKKGLIDRFITRQHSADVEILALSDIGDVVTGGTPSSKDTNSFGEEYPFVTPGDLGNNKYIKNAGRFLSLSGISKLRRLPRGSVLFCCIGSTIGKIGIASVDLATNQQINAVIPNHRVTSEFLYYVLLTKVDLIRNLAGTQAVPIVNKSTFQSVEVGIPPIDRQEKAVTVLTLIDEEIEHLRSCRERFVVQKQALMQKLLTGKIRVKV